MGKYVYPAVFTPEEGSYNVEFPDIEGCYTCGDNLTDAMTMAEDALALMLLHLEEEKKEIPAASNLQQVQEKLRSELPAKQTVHTAENKTKGAPEQSAFVSYIACDTLEYAKRLSNRSVKKTLSIPEWLNEAALAAGINFSQTLQEALKMQLGIN